MRVIKAIINFIRMDKETRHYFIIELCALTPENLKKGYYKSAKIDSKSLIS